MSVAQSRLEALLAMKLYKDRSEEIKRYLDKLAEEYGEPKTGVREVRAMIDKALGEKSWSCEIYRMRQDEL